MGRLIFLVKSEFQRLTKYNLFTANFVALLLWLGVSWFIEGEHLRQFIPFVFLMDSTMMTILLVGATLFYEKKEHTVNTIMISPVTESEYLYSKALVNVLNSLFSVVFISAGLYIMKGLTYNYLLLTISVIFITVTHTFIGIKIAYYAKDFTSILVYFMIYTFVFLFPSILILMGVIDAELAKYLIILPPETSNVLISASIKEVEVWKLIFGYSYLTFLTLVLYRYDIKPKFKEYVMRETGV
ncbi:fluoroquinolone export ABC transporter permease subunit [Alkaliphilus serpentinus]|uniref:Fluoroquinolone transport system permease protein n=1 Tax=Alkaliphilus serpentinus TaxID=1482731 RepID=A0A833MAD7_9FIRM|nr:hypothetical protein [Alkaliphilus serpentinus]KAB3530713.1 hypothetical protein F8153_06280 [Alkaliphilus serpentinus]